MEDFDSRWACPKCGNKDVEVAFPQWCREGRDGALVPVHLDDEAEPTFWVCNACDSSGIGWPTDRRNTED